MTLISTIRNPVLFLIVYLTMVIPLGITYAKAQTQCVLPSVIDDVYVVDDALCKTTLSGTVRIRPSGTLSITSGTTLYFDRGSHLIVEGSLEALGTEAERVKFIGINENHDWSIDIDRNGPQQPHITLRYTTVYGSERGIYITEGIGTFLKSHFNSCGQCVGAYQSEISFDGCEFSFVTNDALSIDATKAVIATSSFSFIDSGDAIGAYNHSSLDVKDSKINFIGRGSMIGIYQSDASIHDSIFAHGRDSSIEVYSSEENHSHVTMMHNAFSEIKNYALYTDSYSDVAAEANWWGSRKGPCYDDSIITCNQFQQKVSTPSAISLWLKKNPDKNAVSSIAFIPGIQASRLYLSVEDDENQVWEPNSNSDVQKLMFKDGLSQNLEVYTKDVIDSVNIFPVGPSIYRSFLTTLKALTDSTVIRGFATLPYDWRYDVTDLIARGEDRNGKIYFKEALANSSTAYIIQKITELANTSYTGAVTLVTHSNGGLVAKAIVSALHTLERDDTSLSDLIDQVIFVATPHYGTPLAITSLLYGERQSILGGIILSKDTAKSFAQSIPGAFGLLPSTRYFAQSSTPPVIRDGFEVMTQDALHEFLSSTTMRHELLDTDLLSQASSSHAVLDSIINTFPAISWHQIVGTGIKTLGGIRYRESSLCEDSGAVVAGGLGFCSIKNHSSYTPVMTTSGDGTVVTASIDTEILTENINLASYNRGMRVNRSHADILEVPEVASVIEGIITHKPHATTLSQTQNSLGGVTISIHSPIDIDVTSSDGLHTTSRSDQAQDLSKIVQNIPNSTYSEFDDVKYVFLPDGDMYDIVFTGTDFGIFSLDFEFDGQQGIFSQSFHDVPVSPLLTAHITLDLRSVEKLESLHLSVDFDGDTKSDITLNSGYEFDPKLYTIASEILLESLCGEAVKSDDYSQIMRRLKTVVYHLPKQSAEYMKSKIISSHGIGHKERLDANTYTALLRVFEEFTTYLEQQTIKP